MSFDDKIPAAATAISINAYLTRPSVNVIITPMKLELLKEHYFFELNRKQQLEGSLAPPVAILTALGGVVFSYVRSFEYRFGLVTISFLSAIVITSFSLVLALYYLIRSAVTYTYSVVASPVELLDYLEKTRQYYRSLNQPDAQADGDFEAGLKQKYAEATTRNGKNNTEKASYLYKTYLSLVFAVILLGVCTVPYIFDDLRKPRPIQKIEITNIDQLTPPKDR